jgi:hypothetical protein
MHVALSEGDDVNILGLNLKLKNILSLDRCRVIIKDKRTIIKVSIYANQAIRLDRVRKLLCLRYIDNLNTAKFEILDPIIVKTITDKAKEKIHTLDLKDLEKIVSLAVPLAKPHRYTHLSGFWLLSIKGTELIDIKILGCASCNDSKKILTTDECQKCEGVGCVDCNYTGSSSLLITCQDC